MIVGYARVSKYIQADDSNALEQQVNRLKQAGASEVLVDIGSGRNDSRKQFLMLENLIRSGRVTELVATRVDRLGRSVTTIQRTLKLLQENNVKLRILDAPIDATNSFGWFALSQMADLAEFESRLLSERITHGMNYFRQQGKANSKVPFGYKRVDEKFVPNMDMHPCGLTYWEIADKSIEIFFECRSLRESIAVIWEKYQIKWSVAGFRDWMLNPALLGHVVYGLWHNRRNPDQWDVRRDMHDPLLSEERYQAVLNKLKAGRQKWGRNVNSSTIGNYPLAGLVKCAVCGGNCYRYYSKKNKIESMRCRKRDEGMHLCSNSKSARLATLEEHVIDALLARKQRLVELAQKPEELKEPPELIKLREQLAGLLALGSNEAINVAIDQLKIQIYQAEQQLHYPRIFTNTEVLDSLCDANYFLALPPDKRMELYSQLVERVVVNMGKVEQIILKI